MTPHWLPTRLVDVGLSGDAEWKLCITSEDLASQPPAPRYMTLSYRWGVGQQLLLLGSTLNTFRRGGSLISELPKTFQDLVAVARRFGVRYLWIDCLCIIQDSTDDWEAEAPMMRQVYANSACNVAASASNDPDGGLFRAREPRDDHEPGIRLSEEPHCRNSNRLGDETLSLWQDVMSHYGYRQFTRPSDKLYAISGVAKLFQEVTGQEYLAGLWRSRILEQLDWYVEEPTAASATYRAPSWSWASIDGEVSNFTWDPAHQLLVELLDADVATKGADPTVNVTGGFLKLNGTVIAGSYQRHPLSYEQLHVKPRNEQFEPMTVLSPLPDTSGHLVEDTGELYLLPIKWRKTSDMQLLGEDRDFYSIKCLLLAPVSIPDNIYKRIGCFESPEEGLLQALKSDTIERTAAAEETLTPPDNLEKNQAIVRVIKAEGNNLYNCELPNKKDLVFELAQRFRNTIWIKRGGYVLAERYDEPDGRVMGEIINVVRDEKAWRKQPYWPKEFAKNRYEEDEDESDSNVGKMPPSDSEDEY
nr:eukaryotic translation initiation factor eif1a-like protein [Colletotrichum truncatum]KAF6788277.1 eukaryotic translation initiation factor eif1a-like protein [Colletotrichum truncatum]